MSLYANEAGFPVIAHFSTGREEIYPAHQMQYLTDHADVFWIVDADTGELLYLSPAVNAELLTIVFSGDEPQAMILPVRIDETKSRVPAAVRAYFTEKPQDAAIERAHGQEITRLQNVIDAKNEQIEALTARLNAQPEAQPEPVEEAPQEQTPADKAAALVEKLAALDGITATVKGAQTAAPVVWLDGEADAHKEKIEAMGGKWSSKRSAWYFRI